ncbi:MAG: hypothetical protein SCH98_12320 [Deferrisomatales bacterium]|nr:hypothetical protein [Deferrisomatales bacterium]
MGLSLLEYRYRRPQGPLAWEEERAPPAPSAPWWSETVWVRPPTLYGVQIVPRGCAPLPSAISEYHRQTGPVRFLPRDRLAPPPGAPEEPLPGDAFLQFLHTETTEEGLLSFAERFGPLGAGTGVVYATWDGGPVGELLDAWRAEVCAMRLAYGLAEQARRGAWEELGELLVRTSREEDGRADHPEGPAPLLRIVHPDLEPLELEASLLHLIAYPAGPTPRLEGSSPGSPTVRRGPAALPRRPTRQRPRTGAGAGTHLPEDPRVLRAAVGALLQELVRGHLEAGMPAWVLPPEDRPRASENLSLGLRLVPADLLQALWVQFALALNGHGWVKCRNSECPRWFPDVARQGRLPKAYCRNACKSRHFRIQRGEWGR